MHLELDARDTELMTDIRVIPGKTSRAYVTSVDSKSKVIS